MSTGVWILLGMILGGIAAHFILSRRKPAQDNQGMLMLQNQMQEMSRKLDQNLGKSADIMQKQFGESAKIIREVTERLTKLDETNRQVVGFAEQLRKLQ